MYKPRKTRVVNFMFTRLRHCRAIRAKKLLPRRPAFRQNGPNFQNHFRSFCKFCPNSVIRPSVSLVRGEGSAVVCLCTIDSCSFVVQCSINQMDASLLEELIAQNKPFKIETASGRLFEVPHRDFVSFSTRKTSLIVSYEENSTEHFAIVPLLTITAAMARA